MRRGGKGYKRDRNKGIVKDVVRWEDEAEKIALFLGGTKIQTDNNGPRYLPTCLFHYSACKYYMYKILAGVEKIVGRD